MHLAADDGLLDPVWAGSRSSLDLDDRAVAHTMLRVEREWGTVCGDAGIVPRDVAAAIARAAAAVPSDDELRRIVEQTPLGGNPLIPLVSQLRARLEDAPAAASAVHKGLTSQDVLDSALQLIAADAIDEHLAPDLIGAGDAAARLAAEHRDTLAIARTLGQPALPTTFGYRAATWLVGVQDALGRVREARAALAVQLGGAVGTSASLVASGADVDGLRAALAARLRLSDPGRPWHTNRAIVLQLGAALAGVVAAAGTIAADVATGSRPELGELAEGLAEGAGGSSAMPHKRNPVRSVMLRGAALQAPALLSTLAAAAGNAVDERPDGAWHAEWPALRGLLRLATGAAEHLCALLDGLTADPERLRANLAAAGDAVLAERVVGRFADAAQGGRTGLRDAIASAARAHGDVRAAALAVLPDQLDGRPAADALDEAFDPRGYLGQAQQLTDRAVAAWAEARDAAAG
ncbi:3-carboxy-cis,cis-muconate cycloisomerase [Pseudoclavibacter endophyticus]|nr:lyase family protein [Pseudoclavibacter endophyticus]GGA61241.1 3-carboxy-cis,cis-muconate cycloisomerase [Pseudoclavibacter endophyticus]